MAMIKRVTLTIAKNNASVKLSQNLRFYKNDSLLLQFEIERWNFEINKAEVVKPLYAVAFVETPDGTDMLECTILDEQIVQFQLLQKHTAIIGQGRMQIVVRDSHGSDDEACQSATPPFTYEVEELINDSQILIDENGKVIITDEAKPVFSSSTFATVDELEELELVDEESYLFVTKDKKSYKAKPSALSDGVYDKPDLSVYALKTDIEELSRQIEELENDNGYLTEIPTEYVTQDELTPQLQTKSDVGHIHDYSELTSLPEIPSLEGYATEKYVMDILGNIQGGDGNVNIDLELRLKDDLNDTEEPSVKLARAVINSVLNKPTTKEYTITYRYLCDGISIRDEVVETVAEGTIKIFNISNALVIDGYEISSVNPTNATVNNNIVVTYEYIKICVHNYTETITKQPTCTEKGIKTYTCEECGDSYAEEMPMLEHIYVASITKAATCTEKGIKTYTCELCGDSYTEEIPKEPHEYVNGICTNCGEHPHEYVETITKQPTCTEKGIKTYTCSLCEDSYTEEIPMLEHTYTSSVTKQPSCTEEGVRTYTCSGCNDTYTEVIPMTEHEYVDGLCVNCGNSEFPIHPTYNEVELTSLFDFTQYPNSLMGSGGSTVINKKTSIYFDSAVIDVSKYIGQKLRIKMPAYTSTSGGSSFGRTCLVSSNENSPTWVQDLHVYDFSPTGASASGQLIEYVIEIPNNAQYLWTSKFNQAALDNGIGTDDFYCTLYKDIVCTNISLNKTSLSFSDYNNQTLSVSVTPNNTTQKIIWDTSDENVARVENGTIIPINNGECIITVSCGTQSATCLIEVNITVSELDITSLFDFTKYPKMIMNTSIEGGTSGTWKSSSYFDSTSVDVSEYAGKTIKIMIPAYTSSTGKNSANVTCLINSLTGNPTLKTILHRWELSPTGVSASGQMVEYIIQLPSDAQYLLTSIFNADAISKGIGDTNFYCKVIS